MSSIPLETMTVLPFVTLPYATAALAAGLAALAFLAYHWALPKPIPGIPYNADAARRLMGDSVELAAVKRAGGSTRVWFNQQPIRHASPLVQIFLSPFAKPTLIMSDYREGNDILLRRTKEFDKAGRTLEAMGGVIANHHISMATSDPQFKANRLLVKDLMTPKFLNEVSAPEIYKNALKFVELWKTKAELAGGRPFKANDDIHWTAFDIIIESAIGENAEGSLLDQHLEQIREAAAQKKSQQQQQPTNQDSEFVFPAHRDNEEAQVHVTLFEAISGSALSPSPRLFHWFNNRKSHIRDAYATKERIFRRQVRDAVERLEAGGEIKSSLDYMIQRETGAARKAGREPDFTRPEMKDELWGYVGAGHDTTSTSVQWAVKHLSREPEIQRKLRAALRAAHPAAAAEGRPPTIAEITSATAQVPYLEGFMEEVLRLTSPVKAVVREATVDTRVLGHAIPRGTSIFINIEGASMTSAAIPVDETLRSDSCRSHPRRGDWDGADPAAFRPERWIAREEDGTETFDMQAGPLLSFGGGIRGCFGRRLAYLEFRIIMTLLSWSFEFLPVPDQFASFTPRDFMISKPNICYVRLAEAK